MTNASGSNNNARITLAVIGLVIVVGLLVIARTSLFSVLAGAAPPLIVQWMLVLAVMAAFLVWAGHQINGRWMGVLIDQRYKMSLSRLQVALWTILVLSAYLTIALPRIFGTMTKFEDLPANDSLLQSCRDRLVSAATTDADKASLKNAKLTAQQCDAGALQITFPPELVLAMGISITSFAGSTLIQSTKQKKVVNIVSTNADMEAARARQSDAATALNAADTALKTATQKKDQLAADTAQAVQAAQDAVTAATAADKATKQAALDDLQKQAKLLKDAAGTAWTTAAASQGSAQTELAASDKAVANLQKTMDDAEGLLHKNSDPSQASWTDLFRGDEIGNYKVVDMSKVQMFFFTIVIILTYAATIAVLLRPESTALLLHPLGVDFPPFSNSLNALLGISHGGYLAVKNVDHTRTQS